MQREHLRTFKKDPIESRENIVEFSVFELHFPGTLPTGDGDEELKCQR